jgi:hypothetical protein
MDSGLAREEFAPRNDGAIFSWLTRWSNEKTGLHKEGRLHHLNDDDAAYFASTYLPSFTVRMMRERSSRP